MRTLKCFCCQRQLPANAKLKNQNYYNRLGCQLARKREWQRKKMANDPDYKENQRNAQKQWQENNPDYWQHYRRNRRNSSPAAPDSHGAKMDTLPSNFHIIPGEYLIAPVSPSGVKMDAVLVKIIPFSAG